MKTKVYNMQNAEVAELELNDSVFGAEYNEALIHQVVVAQDANLRQGTKSTLTRSEVRGHAKKPWKQKHTGHARQGSTKGPQFVGGGVVFAPKPRDFSKRVNKFAKRAAFVSALSQKLAQNEVVVLDQFKLANAKTKEVQAFLDAFKFDKTVCLVLAEKNDEVLRASNNIARVDVTTANLLNVSEIVKNKVVVLTTDAVKSIEEAYAE
ncbi:MAG: 50S ribosomal protein L4 [Clostridiales bacterium]|nr:50S ribosomal protein L4 [Clostridiales bacterium]